MLVSIAGHVFHRHRLDRANWSSSVYGILAHRAQDQAGNRSLEYIKVRFACGAIRGISNERSRNIDEPFER